ncbi:unnamed protein product, partial [Phaeothamnion confervicola]
RESRATDASFPLYCLCSAGEDNKESATAMPHTNREQRAHIYREHRNGGRSSDRSSEGAQRWGEHGRGGDAGGRGAGDANASKKRQSFKNQMRGVSRMLSRPGLDPDRKAALEASFAELQGLKADRDRRERERQYAVRYHKVKFFERQKLGRRLRKVCRQLTAAASPLAAAGDASGSKAAVAAPAAADGSDDDAGQNGEGSNAVDAMVLEAEKARLEDDLRYVIYYPKDQKYVGVFPDGDGGGDDAKTAA